jgi:hypothetical protein
VTRECIVKSSKKNAVEKYLVDGCIAETAGYHAREERMGIDVQDGAMMGRKSPSEEHRLSSPWWMVGREHPRLLVMHVKEGRTKTFVTATN